MIIIDCDDLLCIADINLHSSVCVGHRVPVLIQLDMEKVKPEVQVDATSESVETEKGDVDTLLVQLLPMFYGSEENTLLFLNSIQGMKGKQITDIVNKLIVEKKLSELSCHRELYTVLHNAGIYDKSESNWNMQVK